jgi:hypothetical protein
MEGESENEMTQQPPASHTVQGPIFQQRQARKMVMREHGHRSGGGHRRHVAMDAAAAAAAA